MSESQHPQEALPTFPSNSWGMRLGKLRGVLTPQPDVDSRTKVARLFRVCVGFFAIASIYYLTAYFDTTGGGYRGVGVFAGLALITFGPEAVLQRLLPGREYRLADRLFNLIPGVFLIAMVTQAVGAIAAVRLGSHPAKVFPSAATIFLCICPPEFRTLRKITCYVAAVLCFAVWWLEVDGLAGAVGFLAFMIGSLAPRTRNSWSDNLPPRPMQ